MGWFAAKAYGVEEPPNADEGISMDPSAVKPLTVGESVDALVLQVRIAYLISEERKRFGEDR